MLQNLGIDLQPLKSDVLLASYVLNSVAVKHKLPDIIRYYLDLDPVDLASLQGKGAVSSLRRKSTCLTTASMPVSALTALTVWP